MLSPESGVTDLVLDEHEYYEQIEMPMSRRIYTCDLADVAIILLKTSHPIPVDMTARLLEEGVDVDALEQQHG